MVQRKQMNDEARAILKRLSLEIEPETLVGSLSVSKQQMIEIAKALLHKARVLIMDEPTSALTAKEINELFRIIRPAPRRGLRHRLYFSSSGRIAAYCRSCDHYARWTVYHEHEL